MQSLLFFAGVKNFPFVAVDNAYGAELRSEQVKAALIFNFAKFIQWPEDSLKNNGKIIVFGVIGSRPVAEELEKIVSVRTVGGKKARVKFFRNISEVEPTHILFVDKYGEEDLFAKLHTWKDTSIVTVGESDEFLDLGGIINFVFRSDRVRFEINKKTAAKAHLRISAELISLADKVVE